MLQHSTAEIIYTEKPNNNSSTVQDQPVSIQSSETLWARPTNMLITSRPHVIIMDIFILNRQNIPA